MEQEQNPRTADRKTIEKNRRNHMKALYSKLHSLIPHHPASSGLAGRSSDAAGSNRGSYNLYKEVRERIGAMKEKRNRKMMRVSENPYSSMRSSTSSGTVGVIRSPQIEIHEMGSTLKIVLTTGLDCQHIFYLIIRLVHEDGAEVVNASFSTVGDAVFHTIHSKVRESGLASCGAARIAEKLKKSFNDAVSF